MREAEWLASDDPEDLWRHLENGVSPSLRKWRLFTVACCYRLKEWFIDPCQARAVEAAEQFADGLVTVGELESASHQALEYGSILAHLAHGEEELTREELEESGLPRTPATGRLLDRRVLLAADDTGGVVANTVRPDWRIPGWPVYWCPQPVKDVVYGARTAAGFGRWTEGLGEDAFDAGWEDERRALAGILRDVFGNPFRPVAVEPRWLTSDVVALAKGIYDERAFDRLPILADALMDAGCDHPDVLAHCRDPHAPHVRGCWVVDLVLGLS